MEFASTNITRTLYNEVARGLVIDGFDAVSGMPTYTRVVSEEFISTKSEDVALGFRLLKKVNKKVIKETVTVEDIREGVYALTLEEFLDHASLVERQANGRIKQ